MRKRVGAFLCLALLGVTTAIVVFDQDFIFIAEASFIVFKLHKMYSELHVMHAGA